MRHQLYLVIHEKELLLSEQDFYVEQVKNRLFSQFNDIEAEADKFAKQAFENFGRYASEYDDFAIHAESAYEAGIDHLLMLGALHQQVILGALGGMYHQWDKALRTFIIRELRHTCTDEYVNSLWRPAIREIFDVLKQFTWDVEKESFYPYIDAVRLVVNVYKHGNGDSLNELSKKYPEYLRGYELQKNDPYPSYLDHEMLTVSEDQFNVFACQFKMFWNNFPERIFYTV